MLKEYSHMTSIVGMYEKTKQAAELPEYGEMLFYAGSPTADILVVSEAPTWTNRSGDTFFAKTTNYYRNGEWDIDDIVEFRRNYPFTDELAEFGFRGKTRHRLFEQYVDELLDFVDSPRDAIGFTDVAKRPLEDNQDLSEALNGQYDYREALKIQVDYVDPSVIVCNKKNVSEVVPEIFGLTPPTKRDEIPTRIRVKAGDTHFYIVFSAPAHMYVDTFSKRRLAREIKWSYENVD